MPAEGGNRGPRPRPARPKPRFSESVPARLRRWTLGSVYALQPKRIALVPRLASLTFAYWLKPERVRTLDLSAPPYRKEGLIGVSDDLSVDALVEAYGQGIFPVCHLGPMKWWSPTERAVLFFENAHIERGIRKQLRQERYDVTFDQDFGAVMKACAEPRSGKVPLTWITPKIMDAFWRLHEAGYAHSIEVWDLEPRLVGGIFGIAIGNVFFGESQFSKVRDASKIASAVLTCHLARWGFVLRDGKWMTPHLANLGFTTVDRASFRQLVLKHAGTPKRLGPWEIDDSLDVASWRLGAPKKDERR